MLKNLVLFDMPQVLSEEELDARLVLVDIAPQGNFIYEDKNTGKVFKTPASKVFCIINKKQLSFDDLFCTYDAKGNIIPTWL